MLLIKRLFACIYILTSLMSSALAEKNILEEEISILDNDELDQEINKLNTLNFNSTSSTNKSQNIQSIKAEINLWQRIYSRFDIKEPYAIKVGDKIKFEQVKTNNPVTTSNEIKKK